VTNSGKRAGEEVVELYVKYAGVVRELAGFTRVPLKPGEHRTVEFPLTRRHAGEIEIMIGGIRKHCKVS